MMHDGDSSISVWQYVQCVPELNLRYARQWLQEICLHKYKIKLPEIYFRKVRNEKTEMEDNYGDEGGEEEKRMKRGSVYFRIYEGEGRIR